MNDPRLQAVYEFSRVLILEYTQDQYHHREDAKAIVKVARRFQELITTPSDAREYPIVEPVLYHGPKACHQQGCVRCRQ